MLEFRGVDKVFMDMDKGKGLVALNGIELHIEKGEFVCLIGPSGCGKTTLMNIAAGFEVPTRGEVLFEGRPLEGPGPERAVVFQEFSLFPWMSVIENIEFALRPSGSNKAAWRAKAMEVLELVGLTTFKDARPSEISGGMKQRVAIARALALDSKILLMDEPFGSLDEQTRKRLDGEVLRLWRLGRKTVLFITHSIEEAICLGTRVVLMSPSPGRILKQWDIDMDWPRDPFSPRFEDLKSDIIAHLRTCACAQTPKESTGGFITIDEEIA